MHVFPSKQYNKSLKKVLRSGKVKIKEIDSVVDLLSSGKRIPESYRDHPLHGVYVGYRECHIKGDLLIVYKIEDKKLVLILADIGSHNDLF